MHTSILLWSGIFFIHSLLVHPWADGHVVLPSVSNPQVQWDLTSTLPDITVILFWFTVYLFLFFSCLLVWAYIKPLVDSLFGQLLCHPASWWLVSFTSMNHVCTCHCAVLFLLLVLHWFLLVLVLISIFMVSVIILERILMHQCLGMMQTKFG